ncbi:MAG: patatin-like phospholipase family protein [Nitrospirota bacterium]
MKKKIKEGGIRIGLALGGGGARGFAHIGILKVLEENRIPISVLAGTSFGAIIGGLYSLYLSAVVVEERSSEFLSSPSFNKIKNSYLKGMAGEKRRAGVGMISLSRQAFIRVGDYLGIMRSLAGDRTFEDTKIPFAITATDIINERGVILVNGALDTAFAASCSIPGIFPPVSIGDRILVDGGWSAGVPVEAARMLGADIIIAIDTSGEMNGEIDLECGLGILLRSDAVTRRLLSGIQIKDADIAVKPDLKGISWDSFNKAQDAALAGEAAARSMVGEILQIIDKPAHKNKGV